MKQTFLLSLGVALGSYASQARADQTVAPEASAAEAPAPERHARSGFGMSLAVGMGALDVTTLPVLQLRSQGDWALGRSLSLRLQVSFLVGWSENLSKDFYGLDLIERNRSHALLVPVLVGLHPTRWFGVYVGPLAGVGWAKYERNVCAEGWKTSVPFGAQLDAVARLGPEGRLEAGLTGGYVARFPLVECTTGPSPSARIDDDGQLLLGASVGYRFGP